ICLVGQNVNRRIGTPRGLQRHLSQLIVYFALLLALRLVLRLAPQLALRLASPDVDGGPKSLAACRWSDRPALTSICRTGVRYGVRIGVRTLDSKDRSKAACHLALRRHGLADIYMSMPSALEFTAIAGGSRVRPPRQPRRGSADLRLLVGPPGRLIGWPAVQRRRREQIGGCGFPRAEAGTQPKHRAPFPPCG